MGLGQKIWGNIGSWVSGVLQPSAGGTGATTLADGGIVIGNGTSAVEVVTPGATTEILVGGGAATKPVWTTATGTGAPVRATSPTLVTPALGTPSSGTVTNLTGTASININGTVGATTPAAGAFTTLKVTTGAGAGKVLVSDASGKGSWADIPDFQLFYGVSWDESADTYVRTGSTAGQTCGVTLADAFLSVHRRIRRCILNDDGTVNYYLSATDSTKKEGPAYATGTITSDGTIPSDGDTVTIGSKTYTFKTALTPTEGQVLIGVSAATALDNLKSAIMHTGTPNTDYKCAAVHPQVIATDNTDTTQVVVSVAGGTAGNAYALAVSDANMSVSGAFMAGGAANADAVLDGTDGQVMVEIPKFWYRYGYSGTTHTWEISPVPLAGFEIHPAFMSDTTELDYVYVGAYEASLEDVSASLYVGQCHQTSVSAVFATSDDSITIATRTGWTNTLKVGQKLVVSGTDSGTNDGTVTVKTIESATKITVDENLTDQTSNAIIQTQTDTTNDKLASVSGVCPISGGSANGTRAHFRAWAVKRGAGWSQMMIDVHSMIQLLYLTEYASFYSQSVLGYGIAAVADWLAYNDYNPIAKTGHSNVVGNATGNTATAAITTGAGAQSVYLSYRGLENFYGHLWKWVDGFNINNNIPYLCNNPTNFADDTTSNYTRPKDANGADITMYNYDGFQGTLELNGRAFMPASLTGGSASAKITDSYYQNTGWRVASSAGGAYNDVIAGFFYLNCTNASGHVCRNISGRLVFRK